MTLCRGALAGSAAALLGLEVGDSDSVGMLVLGKQEYTFKYSCPRGKWVHVAVTASAVTPASETAAASAGRLELFADGRCVQCCELQEV
jgi:hypothetical protein